MRCSTEWRFVLTDSCNLNCCFCMKEYCPANANESELLPPGEYGALAHSGFVAYGIDEVTLTGGEPLLREDFGEIAQCCKSAGPRVTTVTNGTMLGERIDDLGFTDELHVSLHSLRPARWRAITAGSDGDFDAVLRGVDAVRCRYPSLRIKLNVVGDTENGRPESIRAYVDLARALNLEISVFREGYLEWAARNHLEVTKGVVEARVWDVQALGARKTAASCNKTEFDLGGVSICLCETSTHVPTWDSIWVDPSGRAFVDIMSGRQAIRLDGANDSVLREQIVSLLRQASVASSGCNPFVATIPNAPSNTPGGLSICEC